MLYLFSLCVSRLLHPVMADSSGSALQAMEATIQKTASVLSGRGGPNSPSKGFQLLVRAIGEAKTKHVTADHDSGGVANHLTMTNLLECNFHSLFNMSSIKIPYHLNTSSTHSLTHHMYPHTLTLSFRKRTES